MHLTSDKRNVLKPHQGFILTWNDNESTTIPHLVPTTSNLLCSLASTRPLPLPVFCPAPLSHASTLSGNYRSRCNLTTTGMGHLLRQRQRLSQALLWLSNPMQLSSLSHGVTLATSCRRTPSFQLTNVVP